MRITKYLILAAAILLPGCQKEAPGGGELPMRVEVSLAGDTKGGLTTADLTEFYLQLSCDDSFYSYFSKMTKSGKDWAATKQLFWKDKVTPVSCSAAFFGDHAFTAAEFADGVDLAVPANQSTESDLKRADLLTMPTKTLKYKDTDKGAMTVELSHGLSKVNFVLSLGMEYYSLNLSRTDNPVSGFIVNDVNLGFTFKPGTVTVKPGTKDDITPFAGSFTPSTSANKIATASYEAILVPQTFAAGELRVSFIILGGRFTWTNSSAITLESGMTYSLPLSAPLL